MPASHFDVKPMTGRPKFIVRHSTIPQSFWNTFYKAIFPFSLVSTKAVSILTGQDTLTEVKLQYEN
jgi:hypothetical protein